MCTTTKTNVSSSESQHKKKSAPSGALIPKQDYSTTPEEKSEAEILFDKIGTGKEHAVKVSHRDNNDVTARDFRSMVAVARRNGDVIINEGDGAGYYRPNTDRPEEIEAAKHYIRSLLSRASKLENTAQCMAEALGGRYMTF